MSQFILLRRNCPICLGARRDCRENSQSHLIHCRHDAFSTVSGFQFVGQDTIGFNMWAVDDGRSRDSADWETQRQQRAADRERRLKKELEHFAQSLTADERDRNIRKIHAQVGLSNRHRQDLRERRLTDAEIEAGKFFSIAPWQEVSGINPQLAGVDLDGRKLLISKSGFACPIWDVQGRVIGWQTRFDDATDNKYKWPKSQSENRPNGATAHLQNGELPISCCRPLGGEIKRNSIGLAEGFLKPFIAAQRQKQIFIGAAGGNFASSPQQLKAALDALSAELGTKTIDLYPDAGTIANNAVMRQYERIQMVTDWGYSVRVAWWGQTDKSCPDIDELPEEHAVAYLTFEEFLELARSRGYQLPDFRGAEQRFSTFGGWLSNLKRLLSKTIERRNAWGFGRKDKVEVKPTPTTTFSGDEYESGTRLDEWASAKKYDKHILDTSPTGTGKSFDAGMATPELFDAKQLIYVSAEHRNPTVPTLKSWSDLEARHKGLVRDEFGKLRRVTTPGQPYVVSPNCSRNDTISALRSKNIGGADTAGLICQTCPNLEPCQAGAVFGFLHDRQKILSQSRFRAHPQSLPDPAEFDYSSVVLLWDEASEIIKAHRSIDVTAQDLQREIAVLAVKLPLVFDALRPVLTALSPYLTGEIKQPYYGWKHTQIREALPFLFPVDMAAIREALTPDLDELLNTTKDYGVDLGDLPRRVRKNFTDSDAETSTRISNELSLNWLPDFLDVHLGNVVGNLRVQNGTLTITLPDPRLGEIARAASGNIFLDATAKPEDLALVLGIEPSEILTVRQEAPDTSNLEIIQVATMGRLGTGSKRSEFCQKRVDALIDQIKQDTPGDVAVFDFKRHTEDGDGKRRWWTDTRGVNDLKDCVAAIAVGVPCRNLSELEAEFKVLYGRAPREGTEKVKYPIQLNGELPDDIQPWFEMQVSADPEFREFCRRRILADIHQAIGRLRANLRPGQKLKFFFIADFPLDIPVTLKLASDITPEAATKVERIEMGIRGAVQQLKDAGQRITQSAIATITGLTQGYISRFRKLLQTLLNDSYSKSNNSSDPPPDPNDQEWMSQQYLPLLAESPPNELLEGVITVFEVSGQEVWRQIWDATPAAAQIKILEALMFTFSPGELRSLAIVSGVKT